MKHIFVILVFVAILLAGCSKQASIIGTWVLNSQQVLTKTDNLYTYTSLDPLGDTIMYSFQGGGRYTLLNRTIPLLSGSYLSVGDRLNFYDSTGVQTRSFYLTELTDHNLSWERRDTQYGSPMVTTQTSFHLSR